MGEPVAMVITDGRPQGEDAAELVSVDYEPLPAVVDAGASLAGDTLLFPGAGSGAAHGPPRHPAPSQRRLFLDRY